MEQPVFASDESIRLSSLLELMADGLAEKDFCVIDDFLTGAEVALLRDELTAQYLHGLFKPAGLGKHENYHFDQKIRGDQIRWLSRESTPQQCQFFFDRLENITGFLNQHLFLGIRDAEFHFAKYQPGSFFKRHRDAFKNDGSRKISMIFYLNEGWLPEHGGQLRLYISDPQGNECPLDVFPVSGRLACFKSDVVEHEVLPANRERMSVTGWLKNADPFLFQ